jgi:hypothetical protein
VQPTVPFDFSGTMSGVRFAFGTLNEKGTAVFTKGHQPSRGSQVSDVQLSEFLLSATTRARRSQSAERSLLDAIGEVRVAYRWHRVAGEGAPVMSMNHFHGQLGGGLSLLSRIAPRAVFESRLGVLGGFASGGKKDAGYRDMMFSFEFASEVAIHGERLFGSVGVTLGAGWNGLRLAAPAREFFPGTTKWFFPYSGRQHEVRLGVTW